MEVANAPSPALEDVPVLVGLVKTKVIDGDQVFIFVLISLKILFFTVFRCTILSDDNHIKNKISIQRIVGTLLK